MRRDKSGWTGLFVIVAIWAAVVFGIAMVIEHARHNQPAWVEPEPKSAPRVDKVDVGTARDAEAERAANAELISRDQDRREAQEARERTSATFTAVQLCIRKAESGGDYGAVNPASGASGAWQFIDSTWVAVTGLRPPAAAYDRATQDAAFIKRWANGAGAHNWVTAPGCGA